MEKLVNDVVGACLAPHGEMTIFNELQDRLGSEVALLLQLLQGSANEPASSVWNNMHEWAIQEGGSSRSELVSEMTRGHAPLSLLIRLTAVTHLWTAKFSANKICICKTISAKIC